MGRDGISKVEGSWRNRKTLCNIGLCYAVEKREEAGAIKDRTGNENEQFRPVSFNNQLPTVRNTVSWKVYRS